ncbi:MAG: class I SAM-dependent methyltransferase [Clostridiales bacterium]|nr:class I SAM-dependent methyltransferase [Clostridiales bacterium]
MELNERNRRMREFFDRKADGYDDVHLKLMDSKTAIIGKLKESDSKILDLGIGTGLELIPLFERLPQARVVGIDLSNEMLAELSKRSFADKVTAILGDFFSVDYGIDYDAVISTSALHHFDEELKIELYRRIYDCLKPGGRLINSDKIAADQAAQDEMLYVYTNEPDKYPHIDTPLTVENEIKLLQAVGFKNIEVSEVSIDDYRLITAEK